MGSDSELKEENRKLKEKIEKDLQPKIDKLVKDNNDKNEKEKKLLDDNTKLKNSLKKQNSVRLKNQIDLSPQEIQRMMEENSQLREEIDSLKLKVSNLNIENNEYKNYSANLFAENNQLKLSCGQYQLMLQTSNSNQNMNNNNNNMNSWRTQINDLINTNNFNNIPKTFNNNFNNNNFINNNFNNNFNNTGFGPNMNTMIQGMNMGGVSGWRDLYNTKNQNANQLQGTVNFSGGRKVNLLFRTTKGMKINMMIDFGKTVREMIEIYFKRVEKPDLINRPQDICFIFNAKRIDFNEQRKVEDYFGGIFANITVNDVKDLIGA